MKMKIELGSKVKDVVTGFEGIITCYTRWLTGCDQAGVKPCELDKDGNTKDCTYFDVTRLTLVAPPSKEIQMILDGKMQDDSTAEKTGGPQDMPSCQG